MTQWVDLDDYFAIAAEQLGLDTLTVLRLSRVDLADSAVTLRAPSSQASSSTLPCR